MQSKPRAVVLLSGGLDSTTTLAVALNEGFSVHAITFQYGQRHQNEIAAAGRVADAMQVAEQIVVDIDLRQFGGSALTSDGASSEFASSEFAVPKGRGIDEMSEGIPVTYVPARNTIFLSLALAWAEVLQTGDLFIGVNAVDYSGYPDCRPEYIAAFQTMANLATKAGVEKTAPVRIHTPLVDLTKSEIIALGLKLGVDYGLTTSCYDPTPSGACGRCDACQLRLRGFAEHGMADPAPYSA